jgi:cob(I)alamin adenosyltransferase
MSVQPMPEFLNPHAVVIDGHLDDLKSGIEVLRETVKKPIKHAECAKVLCQISRDLMFVMRPVAEYDAEYISNIVHVFVELAREIRLHKNYPANRLYLEKIKTRANELISKLEATGRSFIVNNTTSENIVV